MNDKVWKLNGEKRWHMTMVLKTASPLHIGSGELCEHPDIYIKADDDKKPNEYVDINACIRGKDNLPIIPGSSIKGKFHDWLQSRDISTELLENLFGNGHDRNTNDQGQGGKVEFHDAFISTPLTTDSNWPYWNADKQTFIETSTAIDPHTKTALQQSLHYTECVPPDVPFQFTLTGVMSDQEAAVIIAVLDSFYSDQTQPYFGADNANGLGRMEYVGHLKVKVMGAKEISNWLTNFETGNESMAMESAITLNEKERQQRITEEKKQFKLDYSEAKIPISLKFDSPFLINDPFQVKKLETDPSTKTDHYPLLDKNKNPRLPATSFRGALRSQAERIIRTLGGTCCDAEIKPQTACKAIYKQEDVKKLCLACQIFGASGWKTLLNIEDFICQNPVVSTKKQEFVAIDRFHGGGKDGAKFDTTHFESPVFKGAISFSPRMQKNGLNWGKGLMALVLRDLHESDITFGFGANKGYGNLQFETSEIKFEQFNEKDIKAFREQCKATSDQWNNYLEAAQPWHCDDIKKPKEQGGKTPLDKVTPNSNGFHNPYHFIPTPTPDTQHWLNLKEQSLNKNSPHSHGFYRDKSDKGDQLYHGRITCQLTTQTPLFIGADKDKKNEPAKINNYELNKKIAIPASSLRGMISALAEAASNSAMRVLDDGLLSYRKDADDALENIGMVIEVSNKKKIIPFSKIIKLKNAYTSNEMMELIARSQSWSPENNKVYYLPSNANNGETVPDENYSTGMKAGILRILGKEGRDQELDNKENELFLIIPLDYVNTTNNIFDYQTYIKALIQKAILIPVPVLQRYSELADERTKSQKNNKALKEENNSQSVQWLPFHLKGTERQLDKKHNTYQLPIKAYDLIYYADNQTEITEVSFSSIWRGRVESSASNPSKVSKFIPDDLLPFDKNRQQISPAELLFGFAELNEDKGKTKDNALAFAGKVRVSAGITQKNDSDLLNDAVTLKALSSPKLPSPSLYFQSKTNQNPIEKRALNPSVHEAKGRKYYLHALKKDKEIQKLTSHGEIANGGDARPPWNTQYEKENLQLKVKIRPITKNTTFAFHLDFNNLSEWELGLLCYALSPTDKFCHRLGMGKPIGLGSVKINIEEIQTINRKKRYAEDEITKDRYNQKLDYKDFRKTFTDTMNADIYRALDLLGNPENITRPVHYPQVENADIEQENFKWFVKNDNPKTRNKQTLTALHKDTDSLPILKK